MNNNNREDGDELIELYIEDVERYQESVMNLIGSFMDESEFHQEDEVLEEHKEELEGNEEVVSLIDELLDEILEVEEVADVIVEEEQEDNEGVSNFLESMLDDILDDTYEEVNRDREVIREEAQRNREEARSVMEELDRDTDEVQRLEVIVRDDELRNNGSLSEEDNGLLEVELIQDRIIEVEEPEVVDVELVIEEPEVVELEVMEVESIQDKIIDYRESLEEDLSGVSGDNNERVENTELDRLERLYGDEDEYALAGVLYNTVDFTLNQVGYLYDVVGGTISRNIRDLGFQVQSSGDFIRTYPSRLEFTNDLFYRVKYRLMLAYKEDEDKINQVFNELFGREMLVVEQNVRIVEEVVEYNRGIGDKVKKITIKDLAKKRLEEEERYEKHTSQEVESVIWLYKEIEDRLNDHLGGLLQAGEVGVGLVASYPNGLSVNYQDINRLEQLGKSATSYTLGIEIPEEIRGYFPVETSRVDEEVDNLVRTYNQTYGKDNKASVTSIGMRKVVGIRYD